MKQYVDRLSGEPARLRADYGTQACRSGVSAVAVEALMDKAREAWLDDVTHQIVNDKMTRQWRDFTIGALGNKER